MTPEPYRKYKNDSSYIPVIAKKIADLKNVHVSVVGNVTSKSARRLFDF